MMCLTQDFSITQAMVNWLIVKSILVTSVVKMVERGWRWKVRVTVEYQHEKLLLRSELCKGDNLSAKHVGTDPHFGDDVAKILTSSPVPNQASWAGKCKIYYTVPQKHSRCSPETNVTPVSRRLPKWQDTLHWCSQHIGRFCLCW